MIELPARRDLEAISRELLVRWLLARGWSEERDQTARCIWYSNPPHQAWDFAIWDQDHDSWPDQLFKFLRVIAGAYALNSWTDVYDSIIASDSDRWEAMIDPHFTRCLDRIRGAAGEYIREAIRAADAASIPRSVIVQTILDGEKPS